MKLTPWFPNSIKPVRVGVYEIRGVAGVSKTERVYRCWNGRMWGYAEYIPSRCKPVDAWDHGENMTGWRGIEK